MKLVEAKWKQCAMQKRLHHKYDSNGPCCIRINCQTQFSKTHNAFWTPCTTKKNDLNNKCAYKQYKHTLPWKKKKEHVHKLASVGRHMASAPCNNTETLAPLLIYTIKHDQQTRNHNTVSSWSTVAVSWTKQTRVHLFCWNHPVQWKLRDVSFV